MEAKQMIINSRKGGLGGSDAKMVLKVGRRGLSALNESDKRRLAVMTGQVDYKGIPTTAAMQRGNEFEAWLAKNVFYENTNNHRLNVKTAFDFDVFAHADFYLQSFSEVMEAKCTVDTIEETIVKYEAQLQWYYLLGVSKVTLIHCYQSDDFSQWNAKTVEKDYQTIDELWNGLALINEFIKDFKYVEKEEWTDFDLMPFENEEVQLMYNALCEMKQLEKLIDEKKANLLELMRSNNVKQLKSELYTITYVPEGEAVTFDKAKMLKEHPEIKESDYQKKSKKSDYLKIVLR
ncbi:MAG TPA: hypothetical protein PLK02_08450 [Paludibacteraceae bacterium]|nr:hypothetical protein [Paludibacteraceae bacterium]